MKLHSIFPVDIASFSIKDLEINSSILEELKSENFISNGRENYEEPDRCFQTNHYLHKDDRYSCIVNFFKNSILEYKNTFELDCDDLEITICWGNKYPKYTKSHQGDHSHRMSYISGVYYLTKGSPTYFKDPVNYRVNNSLEVHSNIPRVSYYNANPGDLVLFPSWLEHGTSPHQSMFDRWSISFNVMPTGKINSHSNFSGNPSCILEVK